MMMVMIVIVMMMVLETVLGQFCFFGGAVASGEEVLSAGEIPTLVIFVINIISSFILEPFF